MTNQNTEKSEYTESVVRKVDGTFVVRWSYWHDNNTDDSDYEIPPGDPDYELMLRRFPELKPGESCGYDGPIATAPSRKTIG